LKALWYASEQFGNLVGFGKSLKGEDDDSRAAKGGAKTLSRPEALQLLKDDYDENYFVSGKGKMLAYDDDCVFADPFVSFSGTQRFVNNVSNLGGLMEDIKLNITDWEEGEGSLKASWTFSCILDLPWKPKLAAGGSTTHIFDEDSGLVVKHIEEWSVEPGKVAKSLLKPGMPYPTSKAEVFMMNVSEGDVKGVWFELSPLAFKFSAPVVALSLVANALTGDGPHLLPGGFEATAYSVATLAALTEVIKFIGQLI